MPTREKSTQIREKIIKAADQLFYQKGYNLTSFSDIAQTSRVPRGNIYYHFKSKDDVLRAVIDERLKDMKQMLDTWESHYPTPLERLKRFAGIAHNVGDEVILYGCPMGSLNSELGKTQAELKTIAKTQFDLFRQWIYQQFVSLGKAQQADILTLKLLIKTQGIAMVAHVFNDKDLIESEVQDLKQWLDSLSNGNFG